MNKKVVDSYIAMLSGSHSMTEIELESGSSFSTCLAGHLEGEVQSMVALSVDSKGTEFVAIGNDLVPLEDSYREFTREQSLVEGFANIDTNYNLMTFGATMVAFDRKGRLVENFGLGNRRENANLDRFDFIEKELKILESLNKKLMEVFGDIENCFSSVDNLEKTLAVDSARTNPFSAARGFVWFQNSRRRKRYYNLSVELGSIVNDKQIDYPLLTYKNWLESRK